MFGFGQAASPVFIDPPVYNDGGLKRVTAAAKPAAMWSLNATTVLDPGLGFSQKPYSNFKDSFELSVPSGPGTNWIDAKVKDGYVVMLVPPDPQNLGPNLTFIIAKDPVAVKTAAAYINPVGAVILDGPRSVIEAAKDQAPAIPGIPGTGGNCPPGTVGIPPVCVPIPGGGGQSPTPPFVPPLPGGGGGAPSPSPAPPPTDPSQTPTPVVPPPGVPAPTPPSPQPPQEPQAAGMAKGGWVLPVLVGIGAISLISLSAASRKKRR